MVTATTDQIWEILEEVTDPEIPVLTVQDLGIIRDVKIDDQDGIEVVITPTYSGCPAMNAIEVNIRAALQDAGFTQVKVSTVLSPAWTTNWDCARRPARARSPRRTSCQRKGVVNSRPTVLHPRREAAKIKQLCSRRRKKYPVHAVNPLTRSWSVNLGPPPVNPCISAWTV